MTWSGRMVSAASDSPSGLTCKLTGHVTGVHFALISQSNTRPKDRVANRDRSRPGARLLPHWNSGKPVPRNVAKTCARYPGLMEKFDMSGE
jgi:hypothetical protein